MAESGSTSVPEGTRVVLHALMQAAAAFCTEQLEGPGSTSWRSWLAAGHQQLPGLTEVVHKCLRQATDSNSTTTGSPGSRLEAPGGGALALDQLQEAWQQLLRVLLPHGASGLPPAVTAAGLAAEAAAASAAHAGKGLNVQAPVDAPRVQEPLPQPLPLARAPAAAAGAAAAGLGSDAASDSGSASSWRDAELQEEGEEEGLQLTSTIQRSTAGTSGARIGPSTTAGLGGERVGVAAAGELLAAGLDPAYCASLAACQQCAAAAACQYLQVSMTAGCQQVAGCWHTCVPAVLWRC
jgi:hypothetical protein